MIYVTENDIKGYLPDFFIKTGTDDNRNGSVDVGVFNSIVSSVVQKIKGLLQPGYTIDETAATLPDFIYYASSLLTVDQLMRRRGQPEHAWSKEVEALMTKLSDISKGKIAVDDDDTSDNYFGTASELAAKELIFSPENVRGSY